MQHEVFTTINGELKQALLPPFQGSQKVRAALIVAVGLGPVGGTTRLALAGGAHVDVTKAWMQNHTPQAGKHYFVMSEDGGAEAHGAENFEANYAPAEESATLGAAAPVPTDYEKLAEQYIHLLNDPKFLETMNVVWNCKHGEATQHVEGTANGIVAAEAPIGECARMPGPLGGEVAAIEEGAENMKREDPEEKDKLAEFLGKLHEVKGQDTTAAPTAADLDAVAEDQKTAEATDTAEGANEPQTTQATQQGA